LLPRRHSSFYSLGVFVIVSLAVINFNQIVVFLLLFGFLLIIFINDNHLQNFLLRSYLIEHCY
jgi:hypothetical protein